MHCASCTRRLSLCEYRSMLSAMLPHPPVQALLLAQPVVAEHRVDERAPQRVHVADDDRREEDLLQRHRR